MATSPGEHNFHFDTEHLKTELRTRSARGGAVTLVGQTTKAVLQLTGIAFLARLLSPGDFGLIAMVAALSGFLIMFQDMGLSMATIQRSEINHAQVSTLFWVNVAVSVMLMVATTALSPAVAWFYKDPRLTRISIALGIGFVFGGLTVQHQALLRRQMRFVSLIIIDLCSLVAGIASGLAAAMSGVGYWSLVLMQLVSGFSTMAGTWLVCRWRPGWPVMRSGVRPMLAFGGHLTGFSIVNYFVRNLDNILIGRYWSALALGLYSRAYSILLAPIGQIVGPITAVANPTLSRLQHDPARYKSFYLKAIRIIAYVTMPLIIALGLLSKEVVLILLGRQWIEAASIFRILAFAAFWQPLSSTVGWLFTSLNQTRRFAIWGLISSPIFVISFLVGLPWGPRGVALCYGIVVWLLVYPCFVFALKYSPVSIGDMITNIYRPFVLSIAAGAAIYLTKTILSTNYSLIRTLCIAPASGVFTLLVCVRLWKAVRRDVADMVAVGRAVVGNR